MGTAAPSEALGPACERHQIVVTLADDLMVDNTEKTNNSHVESWRAAEAGVEADDH